MIRIYYSCFQENQGLGSKNTSKKNQQLPSTFEAGHFLLGRTPREPKLIVTNCSIEYKMKSR